MSAPAMAAAASQPMSPHEAIMAARDAAPRPVPGTFVMRVQATGRELGRVYLNSERDYRDRHNLSIAITPGAAAALKGRYGVSPQRFFAGKTVRVIGAVRRVRIDIFFNSRPTGRYYFQTHVDVSTPDQIQEIGG
jgi:hypothetical protein